MEMLFIVQCREARHDFVLNLADKTTVPCSKCLVKVNFDEYRGYQSGLFDAQKSLKKAKTKE